MPPFFMGESHGDARMGLARLFGLCAALLFASTVATAATIDVGPSDYRNFGPSASHTGGGVRSSFGQSVRLPPTVSGPTRMLPVSRNAVIPYGSIANGAKNFLRINPASAAASAAITALFLGLDWAFDPELDQWMKPGEPTIDYVDPISGGFEPTSGGTGQPYPTAEAACAVTTGCRDSGACTPEPFTGGGYCTTPGGDRFGMYWLAAPICPAGSNFTDLGCAITIEGEWENITDSDWQQLENTLPSSPADQVADAASDIQRRQGAPLPGYHDLTMTGPASVSGPSTTSTTTDPVTGDTIVTTTNTTTNISYGDTTITTTNTTTSTTYQNGQETSTTTTTETPGELPVSSGGGAAGDWPKFCDWATVVCDWLNWTREPPPPEQDLPSVIDDDFYEQKNISFGAKSCPPDLEISLAPFMDTTVGVSFQPFCDFAALIYYMVMAASYIIAAYISIGVARSA